MDKYLLKILHEVNTIIIPGLGALTVTNHKTGEIMFMSYLKHDDGNLAKHIAEKEGISENDAKNLIAKYVREILAKLDTGDTYDMYQFGRFIKINGEIDFENWDKYQNSNESSLESNQNDILEKQKAEEIKENSSAEKEPDKEINSEEKILEPENLNQSEKTIEADSNSDKANLEEITSIENANSIFEDLLEASKPIEQKSNLDAILESKEKEKSPDDKAIEDEKTIEEKPLLNEESPKIDTSSILPKENVYIPKEEVKEIVEKQKLEVKDKNTKEEQTNNQVKIVVKKKKSKSFWILTILAIFLLVGGGLSFIFLDDIKAKFSDEEKNIVQVEKNSESDENLEQIEQQVELENETNDINNSSNSDDSNSNTEQNVEKVKSTNSLNYHTIIGSFGVEANASRLAKKKQAESPSAKVIAEINNMFLVSYESFSTKEEAQAALKKYNFSAWVLKYPK